eukprot:CAMPEP_0176311666 /NCGR_PEP_ID=MMETSP0121_2-20121125/66263_1 /TAXON_ID=160619 /ORGANISM="Kryptoperidinium foliaceum, Strain CCMP 1326" /LENGTH=60 /DNA_ID=CAMNT_0017653709 /DNA_START=35 /DNA_END=214 /DNA_ORIENTATION=-
MASVLEGSPATSRSWLVCTAVRSSGCSASDSSHCGAGGKGHNLPQIHTHPGASPTSAPEL